MPYLLAMLPAGIFFGGMTTPSPNSWYTNFPCMQGLRGMRAKANTYIWNHMGHGADKLASEGWCCWKGMKYSTIWCDQWEFSHSSSYPTYYLCNKSYRPDRLVHKQRVVWYNVYPSSLEL